MYKIKKIFIFSIVLLLKTFAVAQDKPITIDSVIQLIEAKDALNTFDDLLKIELKDATTSEQGEFENKIGILVAKRRNEIRTYFSKKFTQKEIEKISAELSDDGMLNYSQRAMSFIIMWRSKRKELQKAAQLIEDSYR